MDFKELIGTLHLTLRWSKSDDYEKIKKLTESRFGNRDSQGIAENLDNRYLLLENEGGEIVALTGLNDSKYYNGKEIDWTCLDHRYTGHNLMALLIAEVIKDCTEDVYCSCWRFENGTINLRRAMAYNNFLPALIPRLTLCSKYTNCREICSAYNPVDGVCTCYEDLYVRKYNKTNN